MIPLNGYQLLSRPQTRPLISARCLLSTRLPGVTAPDFRRRHASHGARASAQPQPTIPSSSSTSPTKNDKINPPASTRPADIILPKPVTPTSGVSHKLQRFFQVGKVYYLFYKTGLKNVYWNYRDALPLRRTLGFPAYLPTSPPPAPRSFPEGQTNKTPFRDALTSHRVTRSDFHLIRRAAYDMRRMVPFTLMVLICGELTPLVVLVIGNAITPTTCLVPRQITKIRVDRATRKRAAMVAHQASASGSLAPFAVGSDQELDLLAGAYADPGWVGSATMKEVLRACAVFGVVKDHQGGVVGLGRIGARRKLNRHVEFLGIDDELIRGFGGVAAMEGVEVRMAVENRGGVDIGGGEDTPQAERERRDWLERWLRKRAS